MNINYIFEPETKDIHSENSAYIIGCKVSKNIAMLLLSVPFQEIEEEKLNKVLMLLKSDKYVRSVVSFDIEFEVIGKVEKNEVKYNIFNSEQTSIAFYPILPGNCDYNVNTSKELTIAVQKDLKSYITNFLSEKEIKKASNSSFFNFDFHIFMMLYSFIYKLLYNLSNYHIIQNHYYDSLYSKITSKSEDKNRRNNKYEFAYKYNILIDMMLGQILFIVLYFTPSLYRNNINSVFDFILSYYNQFDVKMLNNVRFKEYKYILNIINIFLTIHKWYYTILLLYFIPLIKNILLFLMIFGLSISIQIIVDWIFIFFPSIFIIKKCYSVIFKLYFHEFYNLSLISRGKIYNQKQNRIESWNYRPIKKFIGIFLCCNSILIFPLLFILEVIITILYYIVILIRFLLTEIGVLIYSLPLIEIIDYLKMQLTIVDSLYCKNGEDVTNIHICIKKQSFLSFVIKHFKDKRVLI